MIQSVGRKYWKANEKVPACINLIKYSFIVCPGTKWIKRLTFTSHVVHSCLAGAS